MESLLTSVRVVAASFAPLNNCPDVCLIINEFADATDCPSFWLAVSDGKCERLLRARLLRGKWSERSLIHARGAMSRAAQNGNQDVVVLMHDKLPRNDGETFYILMLAIQAGNVTLSEWLFDGIDMNKAVKHRRYYEEVMLDALTSGSVEMLQWVDDHIEWASRTSEENMDMLPVVAASRGFLSCLKWLRSHNYGELTSLAMEKAALHGHLDVVKWLFAEAPDTSTRMARFLAGQNHHVAVVKFLDRSRQSHTSEGRCVLA